MQGKLVDQFIQETSLLQNDKKKFIEHSAEIKIVHKNDSTLTQNERFSNNLMRTLPQR